MSEKNFTRVKVVKALEIVEPNGRRPNEFWRFAVINLSDGFKRCTRCRTAKPLSEFQKNHACRDGHACECRRCRSKYSSEHYIEKKIANAFRRHNDGLKLFRERGRA